MASWVSLLNLTQVTTRENNKIKTHHADIGAYLPGCPPENNKWLLLQRAPSSYGAPNKFREHRRSVLTSCWRRCLEQILRYFQICRVNQNSLVNDSCVRLRFYRQKESLVGTVKRLVFHWNQILYWKGLERFLFGYPQPNQLKPL